MILELSSIAFGVVGVLFGLTGMRLARQWTRDCKRCRILIARKGKVVIDAPLAEWLQWEKNMPQREEARGGVIFSAYGVAVAIARPKAPAPGVSQETRVVDDAAAPARNRKARRAAMKRAGAPAESQT